MNIYDKLKSILGEGVKEPTYLLIIFVEKIIDEINDYIHFQFDKCGKGWVSTTLSNIEVFVRKTIVHQNEVWVC